MLLCFTLLMLDAVLLGHRRPQPDRQVAFGDAESLALDIGQRADAAALAGDDGIGRLVEQHEHRLDLRAALLVLVAKPHQRVDVDQRKIAGARRDARNRIRRSAGDVGRDRQRFRAEQAAGGGHHERRGCGIDRTIERKLDRSGGRGSSAARTLLAIKPAIAHSPAREAKRALRRERMALVLTARIEVTSARGGTSCRAGDDCFVTSPTA